MAEDNFDPVAFREELKRKAQEAREKYLGEKEVKPLFKKKKKKYDKRLDLEKKTPLQLLKEEIKGRKEVAEYRRLKFQKSKLGKAVSFAQNPIKTLYGSSYIPQKQRKEMLRKIAVARFQRQQPQLTFSQQLQMRARQMGWNPNDLDSSAWDDFFVTNSMEREARFHSGRVGVNEAWGGSQVANQTEREASGISSSLVRSPSNSVSNEVNFFSKLTDITPTLALENEVNAFANILNPSYFKTKRIKRRR